MQNGKSCSRKTLHRTLHALGAVSVVLAGVFGTGAIVATKPKAETRPSTVLPPLVRTLEVEKTSIRLGVRAQGTVVPRTQGALVSEAAGRVVRVSDTFANGGCFDAGDVLLEIDPRDCELAVTRADAQVASAESRLARERAEAEVAAREWRKLGVGEPSALALRKPQLAEAEAALAAAKADLEAAKLALDRTTIRAPYDGRVREKKADVGQYVARGQPVATIYAVDYAEVRLPLSDDELARLDLPLGLASAGDADTGPSVMLHARHAGRERQWQGRIVRTEGVVDPLSRVVYAVVRVKDPYSLRGPSRAPLATGLFVSASIEGREINDVGILPRSALYGGDRVAVIDAEERLSFRSVRVVQTDGDDAVVQGLQEGVRVCLSTLDFAKEGTKVRVDEERPSRNAVAVAISGR